MERLGKALLGKAQGLLGLNALGCLFFELFPGGLKFLGALGDKLVEILETAFEVI
jgi:hypothetical protein